ncbi:MAG TPA: MazG family protein [Pseudonocardiaceae bacterium]|nr:MazG family protein [Pseudonocardiaceae bacterium]
MTAGAAAGSAVVLVDVRLGAVLPAAALPVLRAAADVYAGTDLPAGMAAELGAAPAPATPPTDRPVVVVAADLTEPAAAALHAAGAPVLRSRPPAGAELLSAVTVMDRLRSPGGCPWDAEQTHQSLVQYLVEETFELLEAIEDGDRAALREELGDVLLQVLFHARVAAEDAEDPFTIDDVAAGIAGKLINRHPHVFAGGDPAVRDAASQEHRWEQLKQAEKQRESSVDGVALGQPAVSLAAKLTQRATRAGLPADLLPGNGNGGNSGAELFALAASVKLTGADPEGELRAASRRFAQDVRTAESNARAAGVEPLGMAATDWRRFWPR